MARPQAADRVCRSEGRRARALHALSLLCLDACACAPRPGCRAKQDEREKASTAVAATARKLNNRRGGPRSPGGQFGPDEEEEEEEDTDKLN